MIHPTINPESAYYMAKFGLQMSPRKFYDKYIMNKEEYSYDSFSTDWKAIKE